MSNILKFSDLKSDSFDKPMSDDHQPHNSTINGFLTIDLNQNQLHDESSFANDSSISSGYTSFGQPYGQSSMSTASSKTTAIVQPTETPRSPTKQPQQQPKQSDSFQSIDLAAAGTKLAIKTANTIDHIKEWSKSAYKCTKQIIAEKMGKSSRTIDPELESEIARLRESKKKYEQILTLARSMLVHFNNFIQTQRLMSDTFSELAIKSPELRDEFIKNSETQRAIFKNGETLICALEFFTSSLQTLCSKTIEDTLSTIQNYEAARLEFDVYRTELEDLQNSSSNVLSKTSNNQQQQISQTQRSIELKQNQLNALEKKYKFYKERYEKLRDDVNIKIKFLDENKVSCCML